MSRNSSELGLNYLGSAHAWRHQRKSIPWLQFAVMIETTSNMGPFFFAMFGLFLTSKSKISNRKANTTRPFAAFRPQLHNAKVAHLVQ